jgi:hypothetical protein
MSENRWCYNQLCSILEPWTQMFVIALRRRAMHGLMVCSSLQSVRRGFFVVRFVRLGLL